MQRKSKAQLEAGVIKASPSSTIYIVHVFVHVPLLLLRHCCEPDWEQSWVNIILHDFCGGN